MGYWNINVRIYDEATFREACKHANSREAKCTFYGAEFSCAFLRIHKIRSFTHLCEFLPDVIKNHRHAQLQKQKQKIAAESEIDLSLFERTK